MEIILNGKWISFFVILIIILILIIVFLIYLLKTTNDEYKHMELKAVIFEIKVVELMNEKEKKSEKAKMEKKIRMEIKEEMGFNLSLKGGKNEN